MPGIQQIGCLCENGPFFSSSEHRQLICGSQALKLFDIPPPAVMARKAIMSINATGADGEKIAVLRKGRARSKFF
jgi:hypothetical protein